MAKVLNYKKYHKINVADHRHNHHLRQQQQQQEEEQQQIKELKLLKQQQKQRQPVITNIQTNKNNNDNNKRYSNNISSRVSNTNNNELINYTQLQQHVANKQQPHYLVSNTNFQQLTSVSSYTCVKNRNSKINNNSHNVQNSHSRSLNPPKTPSISLSTSSSLPPPIPPSAACSYSPNHNILPSPPFYLNLSSTYSNYYSTCCHITYNMFASYAEAATLQLKRKTHFNRLLHVNGHPDMRSICYLILMAFFYWGVMIRAAVATNLTTTQTPLPSTSPSSSAPPSSHAEDLNTPTMFYTNLTAVVTSRGNSVGAAVPLYLLANSSLDLPISLLTSDDTLTNYQRRLLMRREAANVPDFDDDDSSYHDDELDEYEILINNKSGSNVTFRSLQYMKADDVKEAIPPLGLRMEFREKLFVWKKKQFEIDEDTLSMPSKVGQWLQKCADVTSTLSSL